MLSTVNGVTKTAMPELKGNPHRLRTGLPPPVIANHDSSEAVQFHISSGQGIN
jgi:hypothetical protein